MEFLAQQFVPIMFVGLLALLLTGFPVAFALAIFEALNLYTPEVRAAWSGLFSTGEARHYHALMAALNESGANAQP